MKKVFIMVVVVLFVAQFAFAGMEGGDKEIQIQGSVSNITNSEDDTEITTTNVQLIFNYFFTPNFSIGGTWWGNRTEFSPDEGDDSTLTNNFLLLRGDGYLGSATSKAVPYLGLHVGQSSYAIESGDYDDSGSTSAYGWHAGLKIFATENSSWNIELNQTIYSPDVDDEEEEEVDVDLTNTQILVGFSYYF
jgi:hypothetical protein